MTEAERVVKPGGQVWVKCMDTIESSKQFSTQSPSTTPPSLGWYPKDLFLFVRSHIGPIRWPDQHHPRSPLLSLADASSRVDQARSTARAKCRHKAYRLRNESKANSLRPVLSTYRGTTNAVMIEQVTKLPAAGDDGG